MNPPRAMQQNPNARQKQDRRSVFDALKPTKSIEKPTSRASPTTPARPAGSSFIPCPLCSTPIHYKLIESHAASCTGTSHTTEPPPLTASPAPHPSRGPSSQSPLTQGSQAAPDALCVLMVNQQARSQVYHFHLHWGEDHGWRWVWLGQAQWGSPEGARLRDAVVWQASMQVAANIHAGVHCAWLVVALLKRSMLTLCFAVFRCVLLCFTVFCCVLPCFFGVLCTLSTRPTLFALTTPATCHLPSPPQPLTNTLPHTNRLW